MWGFFACISGVLAGMMIVAPPPWNFMIGGVFAVIGGLCAARADRRNHADNVN